MNQPISSPLSNPALSPDTVILQLTPSDDLGGFRKYRFYSPAFDRLHSQTFMAQLPKWFDDYNSYHPQSALGCMPDKLFSGETSGNLNILAVLVYGVKTIVTDQKSKY